MPVYRLTIGLLFVTSQLLAQSASPRAPRYSAPRFAQLMLENDALQVRHSDSRDGNFTNGVRLDLMGNYWKRLPTRFLLLELPRTDESCPDDFDDLFTVSVGQEMYTPYNIRSTVIDSRDRPYAGWLYVASGLTTVDVRQGRKLTSSLSLGVMGPHSFAGETQSFVHRIIKSPHPEGWPYQIRDAVGLSYAVRYEFRPLPQIHRAFDLISLLEGHAGTVSNYVGGGFTLRIGQFNDYFQNAVGLYDPKAYVDQARNMALYAPVAQRRQAMLAEGKPPVGTRPVQALSNRRCQFYVFMRPVARIMFDNSFLQGGWFVRDNPYTLRSEDVNRFYVNVEYGGVLAVKRFQVVYTQSFRTPEFRFGNQQQWGRLSLMVGLKYADEKG